MIKLVLKDLEISCVHQLNHCQYYITKQIFVLGLSVKNCDINLFIASFFAVENNFFVICLFFISYCLIFI